jgi:hypothetical protein
MLVVQITVDKTEMLLMHDLEQEELQMASCLASQAKKLLQMKTKWSVKVLMN